MLSDRDLQALRNVERQFLAEDPDLARSFDVGQRGSTYSLQWAFAMPRWVYTAAMTVAVALGVLMLLAHAPGTALVFAALATAAAMLRQRREQPAPRSAGQGTIGS